MYLRHSNMQEKGRPPLEEVRMELHSISQPIPTGSATEIKFPPDEPSLTVTSTEKNASLLSLMNEATIPIFSVNGLPPIGKTYVI